MTGRRYANVFAERPGSAGGAAAMSAAAAGRAAEASVLWKREPLERGRAGSCGKPEFNLLHV